MTLGYLRNLKDHRAIEVHAPIVLSPRFRDVVRRVTERGRSQRNARGRSRVDIDSPWLVLGESVSRFLHAKHKTDRGDDEGLRAFVKTSLAKIWPKDALYSKLKVSRPGPGYCHFPIAYQQEFFNQLTTEEVRMRFVRGHPVRYWFTQSGKRNEALDRRVYALVALHARPVSCEVSCAPHHK